MVIGVLMLVLPGIVFILTLPFSSRLKPRLRQLYRIAGGIIVFLGSSISFYFAFYTGDQGGIAAYFFQITVILTYILFTVVIWIVNGVLRRKGHPPR